MTRRAGRHQQSGTQRRAHRESKAQRRNQQPGAWSVVGEVLAAMAPWIISTVVLVAIGAGIGYVGLPSDSGRVVFSLMLGVLFAGAAIRSYQAIGWWRGGPTPDYVRGMFDSWELGRYAYDGDLRRAVCAETLCGVVMTVVFFIAFLGDGRPWGDLALKISIGVAAATAVLWLGMVGSGRPRFLLPAQYRHADARAAAQAEQTAAFNPHSERPARTRAQRRARNRSRRAAR